MVDVTTTNFVLSGSIGLTYPMYFTKFIVDYMSSSTPGFYTYSSIPFHSNYSYPTGIAYCWVLNATKDTSAFYPSILSIIANFSTRHFNSSITKTRKASAVYNFTLTFENVTSVEYASISVIELDNPKFKLNNPNVDLLGIGKTIDGDTRRDPVFGMLDISNFASLISFSGIVNRFTFSVIYEK